MVKNANAFLDSLTPEQREKAADPLDSPDRTHWNFIPTNQFPRQGLPIKEMTEPQRKLAHELLQDRPQPARLHDDDGDHDGARGDPAGLGSGGAHRQGARRPRLTRDPELYFFYRLRHARRRKAVGLAGRGASRVAALHDRRRLDGGRRADVLGHEPGGSALGSEKGLRTLDKEEDAARAL